MSVFSKLGVSVASPVDAAGNPRKPVPQDFQVWMTEVERLISAVLAGGGKLYQSKALMSADLSPNANTSAIVIGDPVSSNNGLYVKLGVSGTGSWHRVGDIPGYQVIALVNAGGGGPNAINATALLPVPVAPFGALLLLNITDENGGPATLSINGSPARPLVSNTGTQLQGGYLKPGMIALLADDGLNYRLISDVDSAANLAAAEIAALEALEAKEAAEAAKDAAAAYANDAVSQGNVPIYATALGVSSLEIPAGISAFRVNGSLVVGDGGEALFKRVSAEPLHGNKIQSSDGAWWERVGRFFDAADHSADWLGNGERVSVPSFIKRNWIDFSAVAPSNDTQDMWPALKALLENPSAERDSLQNGAVLNFSSRRAYRLLSRAAGYITLPQNLHVEMEGNAFLDASSLGVIAFAPAWFTYNGGYGRPTRPVVGDYLGGNRTFSIPLGSGQVAALGIKRGDRMSIRATEGLTSLAVGAFSLTDDNGASYPTTFTFFAPATSYAVGNGVISVDDGNSYRCTVAHTSGATINLANFVITGVNAKQEDFYVDGLTGDTIRLVGPLRYDYPVACRPLVTKYERQGSHTFRNFNVLGTAPDANLRGDWATATAYAVGDMVPNVNPSPNRNFICVSAHTSGVWNTDVAAGRWVDLGSDRLYRFGNTGKVLIEGGEIRNMTGHPISAIGVEKFVLRDHEGHANPNRNLPGGYLYIGGAFNSGLIENTRIRGAAQPFMMSQSGGEYGVSYGLKHVGCVAVGSPSGFCQHDMIDNTVYDNCEHNNNNWGPLVPRGSSFDIRTTTHLYNCLALNSGGSAMLLRANFMGRGQGDCTDMGVVIDGFTAYNCLSGIIFEDVTYQGVSCPVASGRLEIKNSSLMRIGGAGSRGGIRASFTQQISGAYPVMGKVIVNNVNVEMTENTPAVRMDGRFASPEFRNISVTSSTGLSTGRPLYITSASGANGAAPTNVLVRDLTYGPSFPAPFYQFGPTFARWTELFGDIAAVDIPSLPGTFGNFHSFTIPVNGAKIGDHAAAQFKTNNVGGIMLKATVLANDVVTVHAMNITTTAIDPVAADFVVKVERG